MIGGSSVAFLQIVLVEVMVIGEKTVTICCAVGSWLQCPRATRYEKTIVLVED